MGKEKVETTLNSGTCSLKFRKLLKKSELETIYELK